MVQVTVEKEAIDKAVKTKPIRKVCPFRPIIPAVSFVGTVDGEICIGEKCQIWDEKYGRCQIENLQWILDNCGSIRLLLEAR